MSLTTATIAFYNLENLFDVHDDAHILDDDFVSYGKKKWRKRRYRKKLNKLANAIFKIGTTGKNKKPPILIGIAEVENKKVISDLIQTGPLKNLPLDFIHFDSPDERGIDTALIYHTRYFKVVESETLPLIIYDDEGLRDFTRDILWVKGELMGESLQLLVNHWPSRRAGAELTEPKRLAAARVVIEKTENSTTPAIIMGDFNDNPDARSLQELTNQLPIFNPMRSLLTPYQGSAYYKGEWSLFDQILLSHKLLKPEKEKWFFNQAAIYRPKFLQIWKGRDKGAPYRTYKGQKYLGGYSDHFPVYVTLRKNR